MTVAEFLDWEATQPEKQELYQGEIFAMTGARQVHVASEASYGLRLKSLDFHATPAEVFEDLEA
jgi:Uma2 family endonuclease